MNTEGWQLLQKAITALQEFLDSNRNVSQEMKEAIWETEGEIAHVKKKIIEQKTRGAI